MVKPSAASLSEGANGEISSLVAPLAIDPCSLYLLHAFYPLACALIVWFQVAFGHGPRTAVEILIPNNKHCPNKEEANPKKDF